MTCRAYGDSRAPRAQGCAGRCRASRVVLQQGFCASRCRRAPLPSRRAQTCGDCGSPAVRRRTHDESAITLGERRAGRGDCAAAAARDEHRLPLPLSSAVSASAYEVTVRASAPSGARSGAPARIAAQPRGPVDRPVAAPGRLASRRPRCGRRCSSRQIGAGRRLSVARRLSRARAGVRARRGSVRVLRTSGRRLAWPACRSEERQRAARAARANAGQAVASGPATMRRPSVSTRRVAPLAFVLALAGILTVAYLQSRETLLLPRLW